MDRGICAMALCLLVPACRISVPEGALPCASERDCPVTWQCSRGTCVQALRADSVAEVDVATADAGSYDASAARAESDASTGDDGGHDASQPNATAPPLKREHDASTPDARVPQILDAAVSGDATDDDAGSSTCPGMSCPDSSTQPDCHTDFGAQCGGLCDTPGTIQCDGTCSQPDPVEYGADCGHCGGHTQCDGSCDFPDPPQYGELCSDLVSSVGCSGGCECVRQCPGGQLVPCARLCPILCRDGFCEPS